MMTSYETALKRLFDLSPLPKLGLERMVVLMADLKNPQNNYLSFHVAGTNGKGSTCAFLESILRAAGYKTGLYTSPHLTCARERIQIDRELISEEDFVRLEQRVGLEATFFERITAMAFLYFAEQKVDVAIIEVGLGGRLDATNIIKPIVCGISRIDLDHQSILGDTLEQIAIEKAGIIKPGVPVCSSPQELVVEKTLGIPRIPHQVDNDKNLGLFGHHQVNNASLAVSMIKASGLPVSESAIKTGLENTRWPCRYEFISDNILLDGAHNPAGTQALIRALQEDMRFQNREVVLWVGLTEGHASQEIADLWANFIPKAKIFAGQSQSLRALPAETVKQCFNKAGFKQVSCETPTEQNALFVVTGSLYWTGEIRARFLQVPVDSASTHY